LSQGKERHPGTLNNIQTKILDLTKTNMDTPRLYIPKMNKNNP